MGVSCGAAAGRRKEEPHCVSEAGWGRRMEPRTLPPHPRNLRFR
jgi:hypothetical protein